jgi:hypothetical protein
LFEVRPNLSLLLDIEPREDARSVRIEAALHGFIVLCLKL